MSWQPIETAPKDGTEILVADAQFLYINWAFYDSHPEEGGWFIHDGQEYIELRHPVEMWLPLPEPLEEATR